MRLVKVSVGIYRTDCGGFIVADMSVCRTFKRRDDRYRLNYTDGLGCKVVKYFPTLGNVKAFLARQKGKT